MESLRHTCSGMQQTFFPNTASASSTSAQPAPYSGSMYSSLPPGQSMHDVRKRALTVAPAWNDVLHNGLPDLQRIGDLFRATEKGSPPQDCAMVSNVLKVLAAQFDRILDASPNEQKKAASWNRNFSKILHGCMQFSDLHGSKACDGLDDFLIAVARSLTRPDAAPLSSLTIGSAMCGLKNLGSHSGTEYLLRALAWHIRRCPAMTSIEVSNTLHGLRNMRPSKGTEEVLRASVVHIRNCKNMTALEIGTSFFGLRRLTWSQGVENAMKALACQIEQCQQLSALSIANVMFSMQNMHLTPGSAAVLRALRKHIAEAPCLSSRQIAMALYGLRNMHAEPAIEGVLKGLVRHVEDAQQMDPVSIVNALQGIKHLSGSPAVCRIACACADHLRTLPRTEFVQAIDRNQLRAEVLGSLLPWLARDRMAEPCQAALDVLYALEKHIGGNQPSCLHSLLTPPANDGLPLSKSVIKDMLNDLVLAQSKQKAAMLVYNFHGLSHDLAHTVGKHVMTRFMTDADARCVEFVFGASTHNALNKGMMMDVVREIASVPGVRLRWRYTTVRVFKADPAQKTGHATEVLPQHSPASR